MLKFSLNQLLIRNETLCHILSGSSSMYLVYSALNYNEEEQNWIVGENETCLYYPSLYAPPTFATALAQLQVFRFIFEFFPQPFIRFNHEAWSYPFAALVPVTACVLQVLVFYYKGTICDQLPLRYILRKLNFQFSSSSHVTRIQVRALMFLLTGFIEILIQSKKQLRSLQSWVRKQKSKVHPAPIIVTYDTSSNLSRNNGSNRLSSIDSTSNTMDLRNLASTSSSSAPSTSNSNLDNEKSSTTPATNDSVIQIQHRGKHHTEELNMFVIFVIIVVVLVIYTIIFGHENMIVYVPTVTLDFFYFVLPTLVVWNSTKISDLMKHRMEQFYIRHGNY